MNTLWCYRLDVSIVCLRKVVKSLLPSSLIKKFEEAKVNRQGEATAIHMLRGEAFPWMSPNIWAEIVSFYRRLDAPKILEFGTGASTLWHVDEIVRIGRGIYIGVENDEAWFWLVVVCVLKRANLLSNTLSIHVSQPSVGSGKDLDVEIFINQVRISLRLRTSVETYLGALDFPCDVIVIDGISRRACVRRVLETDYLKKGGLLVLMEAGRGFPQWWEGKLGGDDDYSLEVSRLMSMGGELLDGNGVDSWPGCKRKSPRPISYYCPMEACKWIKPNN